MRPEKEVLAQIDNDLFTAAAAQVIYLEGKSDPAIFFGLLGVPAPAPIAMHKGTVVKGLSATEGSGNTAVRQIVEVGGRLRPGKVFGIVDGDGEPLNSLAPMFDSPHPGPLFAWKVYSIECLLALLPWPPLWGDPPDWIRELDVYTPYVAMNRLRKTLEHRIDVLRLDRFWNPAVGAATETVPSIQAALQKNKNLLAGLDVVDEFRREVQAFQSALAAALADGLAFLNGKWLLRHFMVTRSGKTPDYWQTEWARYAALVGGLKDVRELWERITGSPP